jgi:taurine--2-oxoglutarate transaminase
MLVPWSVQGNLAPPTIVRGEGSFFFDDQGKRYLDLASGYVAVSLGHGHPAVLDAIEAQMRRLCWAPTSYFNDIRTDYAAALSAISPWAGEGARVHFTCGGAEANDDAIKIARLVTGRAKVLAAYRSYHGSTIGSSGLTGTDRWRDPWPNLPGIVRFFAPFPYRSPFQAEGAEAETKAALAHLEQVLLHEGAGNAAALIIEPVSGSSGLVVQDPAYLQGLREICDRHGILLVFDEVMTGFGRTGAAFAAERLGVAPDLITFAKGASSSYVPLGGVMVRERVARFFDDNLFDVGHTHAGHVLAVAAGQAALKVYQDEGLFERARLIETWLREGFVRLRSRHRVVGDVRGIGALFGLDLVRDPETRAPVAPWHSAGPSRPMQVFYRTLMARGVHTYGRYNLVMVAPPLTVTESELELGFDALDAALSALEAALDRPEEA